MIRTVTIIGAASSAAAYGPGQEEAPRALREAGLVDTLRRAGVAVEDRGDVVHEVFGEDPESPEARNPGVVARVARAVAAEVATAVAEPGDVALVLGGDCTVELGTVAGARAAGRVGLVYIDLDHDLNTPASAEGALDWMGTAHLLGLPGCVPELVEIGGDAPLLEPDQLFYVAADNATPAERCTLDDLGLAVAPLADCVADPAAVIERVAAWAEPFDRVLVHVDTDVLDQRAFPIAENTRQRSGLGIDTLAALVAGFGRLPAFAALTVCEINPSHARDLPAQLGRVVDLVATAVTPG